MKIEESLAEAAAIIKGKAPKKSRKVWVQPTVDDLAEGRVLSFDQTFSKTGWAYVVVWNGALTILAKGYIHEPPLPDVPRFQDILQRTEWMGDRILEVFRDPAIEGNFHDVVHEAPILHGMRVESSLLGAVKVWAACHQEGLPKPSIVENRHMVGVLCPPDDREGKPAITRALTHFVHQIDKRGQGWNEHNRDAVALALTFLYDKKKAQ